MKKNTKKSKKKSVDNRNYKNILIFSIINFILAMAISTHFVILAVILFVLSIKGVKSKDKNAIISMIINLIIIIICTILFIGGIKEAKNMVDKARNEAYRTSYERY